MEDLAKQPANRTNRPFTVLVGSLLTLCGILGIAVGAAGFGFHLSEWPANAPRAVPILVSGWLDLFAGTSLASGHWQRAFRTLLLALACRLLWSVLAHYGWLDTGRAFLELVGACVAWRLAHASKPGPNNSSKPTPLRGAA